MHQPVLVDSVVQLLCVNKNGVYVDATLGSGGHSEALLKELTPAGRLLGIDRDGEAVERARRRLAKWERQCSLVHGNYAGVASIAKSRDINSVDGVLLDLGVSSEQLESPERGFSFMNDGPLDMRMDRSCGASAAELVNTLSEEALGAVLRDLGEERHARLIAGCIVKERKRSPIATTGRLADLSVKALGGRRGRLHPATRTFQALRIAVNNELEFLQGGLSACLDVLRVGGRVAVISFHSLEDRIVKRFFSRHVGRWESLPGGGERWKGEQPVVALVNRKLVRPSVEETKRNPRARSAKLRVVERLGKDRPSGR